jgi:para-nitrobenzyl esterase
MYYFSRVPPGKHRAPGAYHGSEIAYVFDNLKVAPFAGGDPVPWEDTDRKLAEVMSSYWVNFAVTGDPNGKGLLKWPAYHMKDDEAMGFGNEIEVKPVPNKPALDFLDRYFEHLRQSPPVAQ